jgi:hypothetical protein
MEQSFLFSSRLKKKPAAVQRGAPLPQNLWDSLHFGLNHKKTPQHFRSRNWSFKISS